MAGFSWGGREETGAPWLLIFLWVLNTAFAMLILTKKVQGSYLDSVSTAWALGLAWSVVTHTRVRAAEKWLILTAGVLFVVGLNARFYFAQQLIVCSGIGGAAILAYSLRRNILAV